MREKVIEVEGLVKCYGKLVAVNDVSFECYRGEIFSLIGPNGAGKTTTVEILECLRRPTSGSARVLGFDVVGGEREIKKRIGVMPQNFNAFERLTVKENVELIAKIYGVKADIKGLLERMGLWDVRGRRYYTLSGGMKRRVGICMALVSDPEILFLDEPTTGLDPQARRECWEVIRDARRMGKTVFLTTHYMDEVENLSDRASIMIKGKIVATDEVATLIAKYGGGVKVAVKGGKEVEDLLTRFTNNVYRDGFGNIIGVFDSKLEASRALTALYQYSDKCAAEMILPSLEEAFLRLAGGRIDERGELV